MQPSRRTLTCHAHPSRTALRSPSMVRRDTGTWSDAAAVHCHIYFWAFGCTRNPYIVLLTIDQRPYCGRMGTLHVHVLRSMGPLCIRLL